MQTFDANEASRVMKYGAGSHHATGLLSQASTRPHTLHRTHSSAATLNVGLQRFDLFKHMLILHMRVLLFTSKRNMHVASKQGHGVLQQGVPCCR